MPNKQSELRMMWLLSLLIVGVAAWFVIQNHVISLLCGLAFVISIMQYTNALALKSASRAPARSRVPLYLCSILGVIAAILAWPWLFGLALSLWIYFLLSWLQQIEQRLNQASDPIPQDWPPLPTPERLATHPSAEYQASLNQSMTHWLLGGNPVLKGAIVVLLIGVILLLRFATEYWQISLRMKLFFLALIAAAVTAFGVYLQPKNRSFALALQGLGLATLCLDLFFSYYNQIIQSFALASMLFAGLMMLSIYLSLKQKSVELALMAMLIAYIAPFTLPIRNATAAEFLAYYLAVNVAIAILTTLRPWKILNQMGFLITLVVAGSYVLIYGDSAQQHTIALLVILHSMVFIWLAFRFSQLLSQQDLQHFSLKPSLDLGLLFGAPLLAYGCLYLIYFEESQTQAALSAAYAVLYFLLYMIAKTQQHISWIKQSYLSLTLIFIAFIPAILLPAEWSVVGWAVLGSLVFIFALQRESVVSRYVAMALLSVAAVTGGYYLVDLPYFATQIYWCLALCYLSVVVISNLVQRYRQQLNIFDVIFSCGLIFIATVLLQVLMLDALEGSLQSSLTLLMLSMGYLLINGILIRRQASWTWLLPKWIAVFTLLSYAAWLILARSQDGALLWKSISEQGMFCVALLAVALCCIRPLSAIRDDREWVSVLTLISLAFASLTLVPSMPYLSVVILPLGFALWCAQKRDLWQQFWQARSSLVLMATWIISSQLFVEHSFSGYVLPILNPFDAVSIAMLVAFIWMLVQQQQSGLERGLLGVSSVLGVLWLSSYVVLRALHIYVDTPYNTAMLWQDATVQMSLTLLWVSLAFITMQFASRRGLKSVWILGGSILVLVSLKLVLLDLANIGTLSRVLSFLGAGVVMLIIAYIAPMPEDH